MLPLLLACTEPSPTPVEEVPCAEGELLDGESCVPEACGLGPWGDLALTDTTIYVDGVTDGDGSMDAPFRTIQQGADAAYLQGGGDVAIAAGTYVENVVLDSHHVDVNLMGRCRALVVVDGSGTGRDGLLRGAWRRATHNGTMSVTPAGHRPAGKDGEPRAAITAAHLDAVHHRTRHAFPGPGLTSPAAHG